MPKKAVDIIKTFNNKKVFNKLAFNLRGTKRFYIDTVVRGKDFFTVFASHQIIGLIKKFIPRENRGYLLDGTFKIVPLNKYYQLLILHLEYKNDVRCTYIFICVTENANLNLIVFSPSIGSISETFKKLHIS